MDQQQLKIGTELQGGKYRIIGRLGQGGYGITYLAIHTLLDKKMAIKEFFPRDYCDRDGSTSHVTLGTVSNRDFIDRLRVKFVKEARNLARLNNSGIVKIHDVFEENCTAYYVMEWIDGPALNKLVGDGRKLPLDKALRYITQVGNALSYVHSMNITHLDVKPANIMLRTETDEAVLIDFGLSKQYNSSTGSQTSTTPVGISHGFAPLEQYSPDGMTKFSPQTDVYALGATLYNLLTGNVPPQAMNLLESPIQMPDDIPANIQQAIRNAMKPRKTDRTQSMDEFIARLTAGVAPEAEDLTASVAPGYADGDTETPAVSAFKYHPSASDETQIGATAAHMRSGSANGGHNRNRAAEGQAVAPRKSGGNKWLKISAIVLGVVVLGLGGLIAIGASSDDDVADDQTEEVADEPIFADNTDSIAAVEDEQLAMNEPVQETSKQSTTPTPAPANPKAPASAPAPAAPAPAPKPTPTPAQPSTPAQEVPSASGQSAAELYQQAVKAFEADNLAQAFRLYHQAADKGSAVAQFELAQCYYNGWGTGKDRSAAFSWYQKAAAKGMAKAQNQLGECYRYGIGTSVNTAEAIRWYRLAAAQGHRGAQKSLDQMEQ